MTELYSIKDVSRIFALQESRLRYWMQTGFVGPTVRKGGRFYYTFTDLVGVHSVFGAFVLGVSVPRGVLARDLRRAIEPLTTALLVPLFFVYSGLNTRVLLLDSPALWTMTAIVFCTACAGKGLGCWAAARLSGAKPRHALAIATLMNARGMVELILVNLGRERGLITPTLFAMLVLMAIGTTVIAGPIFSAIWTGEEGELGVDFRLAAEHGN